MTIQIKQELHRVNVTDFKSLIQEGEDKEFAIWCEFDSHNFICSFNLFIELQFNFSCFRTLVQCVEFDCSISRGSSDKKTASESFRIWVCVIANFPNLFLMSLNTLGNRVSVELIQE